MVLFSSVLSTKWRKREKMKKINTKYTDTKSCSTINSLMFSICKWFTNHYRIYYNTFFRAFFFFSFCFFCFYELMISVFIFSHPSNHTFVRKYSLGKAISTQTTQQMGRTNLENRKHFVVVMVCHLPCMKSQWWW